MVQLVLNPMWVVKTRLQLQPQGTLGRSVRESGGPMYGGAWDAIRTIARTEVRSGPLPEHRCLAPTVQLGG